MKKTWFIILIFIAIFSFPYLFKNQSQTNPEQKTDKEVQSEQIPNSPEEEIKILIQKNLAGENNMSFPYEDKIEITKTDNGKYSIDIKFNADDNLSKNLIKTGIQMKIAEILTSLYTERDDIQSVTISALFPLQDKYGESFRGDVYVAQLDIDEAKKVNWELDPAYLAQSILPNIYQVNYPNKIF